MQLTTEMWNWLERISNVVGLLGAVFALMAWIYSKRVSMAFRREKQRLNEPIGIVLCGDGRSYRLPASLRRNDVTRQEVLGVVGMLPMKDPGRRFTLGYLSKPRFYEELRRVQSGHGREVLVIQCSPGELNQFDLEHSETVP